MIARKSRNGLILFGFSPRSAVKGASRGVSGNLEFLGIPTDQLATIRILMRRLFFSDDTRVIFICE